MAEALAVAAECFNVTADSQGFSILDSRDWKILLREWNIDSLLVSILHTDGNKHQCHLRLVCTLYSLLARSGPRPFQRVADVVDVAISESLRSAADLENCEFVSTVGTGYFLDRAAIDSDSSGSLYLVLVASRSARHDCTELTGKTVPSRLTSTRPY